MWFLDRYLEEESAKNEPLNVADMSLRNGFPRLCSTYQFCLCYNVLLCCMLFVAGARVAACEPLFAQRKFPEALD